MKAASLGRTGDVIAWSLLTLLLALVSRSMLAAWFMPYDDEGYVQYSLRTVAEGAPLFTTTFSQYGPFFHLLHVPLAKLGYPFSSDAARVCTSIYWVGTSLACGLMARRLSGNRLVGWMGMILAFLGLHTMCREPGHPGGLLVFVAAWAVYGGACALMADRPGRFAGLQGAAAAMMFWTKINIGVFHAAATLTLFTSDRIRPSTLHLLRAGTALLAVTALMFKRIGDPAVQQQWWIFACGSLGLVIGWPGESRSVMRARPLVTPLAGAFLGVTALCLGGALAGGTHWADLIHGTLIAPLGHPDVYAYAPEWRPLTFFNALCAVALAISWRFTSGRLASASLILAKLVACAPSVVALLSHETLATHTAAFQFSAPFAWAFAVPSGPSDDKLRLARHWMAWAFVWHWLQAYPVAGTQIAWGSFLAFPLTALAIHDLAGRFWPKPVLLSTFAIAVFGAAMFWSGHTRETKSFVPLDLPGARTLRLERDRALLYQLLVENARLNGDVLFTFPGMLSINAWSGLPPPSFANTTHWFSLLDEARQVEIIRALETSRLPLVIVWRGHLDYLAARGLSPQGPLVAHLLGHFEPAAGIHDFEIWKRRGNPFVPSSIAYVVHREEGLRLCVASPSDRLPAALEFHDLSPSGQLLERWARTEDWSTFPLPTDLRFPAQTGTPAGHLWVVPLPPGFKPFNHVVEIRAVDDNGTVKDRMRFGASIYNRALTYAPPARSN